MEEINIPPRSSEYIISSIAALSIAAIDLILLIQYRTIFGPLVPPLSLLILFGIGFSLIPTLANLRIRYILTEDRLIVRRAIGGDSILLKNVERAYPHRLSHYRHHLLNLNPAHTVRDGVMVETADGKRLFISPSNREEFTTKIETERWRSQESV